MSTGSTVPSIPTKWIAKGFFYSKQTLSKQEKILRQFSDLENWLIVGIIVTNSLLNNHFIITFLLHLLFAKQWVAGEPFDIPLMYNLVLWNNFPKKITYFHWQIISLDGIWTLHLPSIKPMHHQLSYPGFDLTQVLEKVTFVRTTAHFSLFTRIEIFLMRVIIKLSEPDLFKRGFDSEEQDFLPSAQGLSKVKVMSKKSGANSRGMSRVSILWYLDWCSGSCGIWIPPHDGKLSGSHIACSHT